MCYVADGVTDGLLPATRSALYGKALEKLLLVRAQRTFVRYPGEEPGVDEKLAIVQRAVEAHRGLVLMDTESGRGTTFTVYFPAARGKEEAA